MTTNDGLVTQVYNTSLSNGPSAAASRDAFVRFAIGALGVPADQLKPDDSFDVVSGKFTLFTYRQELSGIEVHDAWLKLLVRNEPGYPLVLVNSSLRSITTSAAAPAIGADRATEMVANLNPVMVNFDPPQLVYYPIAGGDARLAWRFFADSGSWQGLQRYEFFVDAATGTLIDKKPGVYHTDIIGHVSGFQTPDNLPDQPNNPPQLLPVAGAHLHSTAGATAYSDENGDFVLGNPGTDGETVDLDLDSRWCSVFDASDAGLITDSQFVLPPGPADFLLNPDPFEFNTAQLNALTHTTLIHDFIKSMNLTVTQIDIPILTVVNIDLSCNAVFLPDVPSISFFSAGDGCPNTAYASLVYHEYGHFIVDVLPGGPKTDDYHEGMADTVSTLLLNDPCFARDVFGQDSGCPRNVETSNVQYPCQGAAHTCGLVIAGAFWDMRTNLIDAEGPETGLALAQQLYLGQILTGNHRIDPSVTIDLLVLDDDDDDLSNGTPHYNEINDAFSAHNLPGPDLIFATGDYNGDGDVDLFDFAEFQNCVTGQGGKIPDECAAGDFDGDDDIDLLDFRRFAPRFTGDCGVLIVENPVSEFACVGDVALFHLGAEGQDLAYAWFFDGEVIEGATASSLVVNPVTPQSFGFYQAFVASECTVAASKLAFLIELPPPTIVSFPDDVMSCLGDPSVFTIEAMGEEPFTYQWRHDGVDIPGATMATYTIDQTSVDDLGEYVCAITGRCGSLLENPPVTLTLLPPNFVSQPENAFICKGWPAEFTVVVDGPEPVIYQWQFEGKDIPGATESTFAIDEVVLEQLGNYACLVADGCGTSATSNSAALAFSEVFINEHPVGGEACVGDDVFLFVETSGAITYQWFKDDRPIAGETSLFLPLLDVTLGDAGVYHVLVTALCNDETSEDATLMVIDCPDGP